MRTQSIIFMVSSLLALGGVSLRAGTVQMELFNSNPLLDQNALPLLGSTNAGDLVQVILTGTDNTPSAPGQGGNPSGDDTLLFTTHVGYGVPTNPDQGFLDVFPIQYSSALVGSNIYVRFWNSTTAGSATYYGDSAIFALPPGDVFGNTNLDFVSTNSLPHMTDQAMIPGFAVSAVSSNQIGLSWSTPPNSMDLAGYKVYRNALLVATIVSTNYTDLNLAAGTEYCYVVVAVDGGGNALGQSIEICAQTFSLLTSLLGTYNGLVLQTNSPAHVSSGSIRLVLAKTGSFSAKLVLGGASTAFRGQFDGSGNTTNTALRSGLDALQVILHLDVSGGTDQITGTVSDGTFTSELVADRAVFGPSNLCPLAGRYTFVLQPFDTNDASVPQGYGYGTLAVTKTGIGRMTGVLGDGTKIARRAPVSKNGTWPLYASLYKKQGSCIAWVTFSTNETLEATEDWFKPAIPTSPRYPSAFTTMLHLIGGKYVSPAVGGPSVAGGWTLTFGGGNLASNAAQDVTIDAAGNATVVMPGVEGLSLHLSPSSGRFHGRFLHPELNKNVGFGGLLVQPQGAGAGLFLGSTETGFSVLQFNP